MLDWFFKLDFVLVEILFSIFTLQKFGLQLLTLLLAIFELFLKLLIFLQELLDLRIEGLHKVLSLSKIIFFAVEQSTMSQIEDSQSHDLCAFLIELLLQRLQIFLEIVLQLLFILLSTAYFLALYLQFASQLPLLFSQMGDFQLQVVSDMVGFL